MFNNLLRISHSRQVPAGNDPESSAEAVQAPELMLRLEKLENRMMLSGTVVATFFGSDLFLEGDEFDNDVELDVVDDDLVLVGSNNTTINGSSENFVVANGANRFDGSIVASLKAGDDRFVVQNNVEIGRYLVVTMGDGNDSVGVDDATIEKRLHVRTGNGNDTVALRDSAISDVFIATGNGNDTISLDNTNINHRLVSKLGRGNDSVVVDNSTIGRNTRIHLGSGDDELVVIDSAIDRSLIVIGNSGNDVFQIESSSVGRYTVVVLGSGDDSILASGDNQFSKHLVAIAGSGEDQIEIQAGSEFDERQILIGNESNAVPQTVIDTRVTDGAIANATKAGEVFRDVPLELNLDISQNNLLESSDTQIVTDADFVVSGTATPGTTVSLARDIDGLFDDGSVLVDENGDFALAVALINDEVNLGANNLRVRLTDDDGQELVEEVVVHFAVGTVARYSTSLGQFDVELLNEDAPATVENFVRYLDLYENSVVHRSPSVQFIQGGGFTFENDVVESVPAFDPIDGEFDANNLNLRGTLSMALVPNNVDSGTSQWFINTLDNNTLNTNRHTVFGRVIGSGMTVVDAIDQLTDFDVRQLISNSAFDLVPLRDYTEFSETLSGTVSIEAGSAVVNGVGTAFTTEVPSDLQISIDGQVLEVDTVLSDSQLLLVNSSIPSADVAGATVNVNQVPDSSNFVFLGIEQIANEITPGDGNSGN